MFRFHRVWTRLRPRTLPEDLGLGLSPGSEHYRAYVGPPEDYDLVAAMSFGLLTVLGLRQHHTVLDIGCGSLRIGRLLIPYLNAGHYVGVEPNRWLVEEGISRETGRDQIRIKRPRFHYSESLAGLAIEASVDFALAQSIFSHCGMDRVERWLSEISPCLRNDGALVATFIAGGADTEERGWVYPGCVTYRVETMRALARRAGLECIILDWKHPRQNWAVFSKPGFDTRWIAERPLTWNSYLDTQGNAK